MANTTQPIADKILKRIVRNGNAEWVCTPKDFLGLGSRGAVDQALHRLVKAGKLRRVGHGLYQSPSYNPLLKRMTVGNLESAIEAIGRRDGVRILPGGLHAANLLGLTLAVAAKNVYQTDGHSRTLTICGAQVEFRHASPKLMRWAGRPSALVAVALFWRGPQVLQFKHAAATLRRKLPGYVQRDLLKHKHDLPEWAWPFVDEIITDFSEQDTDEY